MLTSVFRELNVFKLSVYHSCGLELRSRLTDLSVSRRHFEACLALLTKKNPRRTSKILLLEFTHTFVVPNLWEFLSSDEHKKIF